MKFIFCEGYSINNYNGYLFRYNKGVSGSHKGCLYLAEAIAQDKTHIVEYVSLFNNLIETTYLNVKYTNYNNFNKQNCDVIITGNDLNTLQILDKITDYKKIVILTHNDLYNYKNKRRNKININKLIIGYISQFAKTNILNVQPFLQKCDNILLYNSIDMNDIKYDGIKLKKSLAYFACIGRGFKFVTKIMEKLPEFKLYTNTYSDEYRNSLKINTNIILSKNTSTYEIFRTLNKCKYFIYPLINLDDNYIHYDTFGYVVLEALLHGVIVIAPKIKVYEELYCDAICYINTDGIITQ